MSQSCCPWMSRIATLAIAATFAVTIVMFSGRSATVAEDSPAKQLRHVVLFKFKESASEDQVKKLVDEFRALPTKIKEITSFEFGTNNSPEGLNDGLTHCFLVTFKDEKGREAYLPHPAHKEFVDHLLPHLDKAVVVDYWAAK